MAFKRRYTGDDNGKQVDSVEERRCFLFVVGTCKCS